ncbi:response regulator transcription factor [Actibacterium sp. MT2.3-13A]|uniref:response regulator transcription factor n=1 Tax=Actibacterium sp. MT2.3-13A TaxID=2828332 RepID=UPI001BA48EBE|nr:response regulator transcription factor [Actibacterium sp. MT2.3-13A]
MALARVAEKLRGARGACADHDRESLNAMLPKGAEPSLILTCLGRQDLQNGRLEELAGRFPKARVVVFLQAGPPPAAIDMLPDNVRAIMCSDCTERQICQAIELVATGYLLLPGASGGAQAGHGAVPGVVPAPDLPAVRPPELTGREWQVCCEVSKGSSNKQIARRLGIAVNTVNVHVGSIMRKLGVHNRTQIALRIANGVARKKIAEHRTDF